MTQKEMAESLSRIEALVKELRDYALFERQSQAQEIDRFIEQWRLSQDERREVPIAD